MNSTIPNEIKEVIRKLEKAGFKAYLVGGCVRDLLRETVRGESAEPKDWDIATDAKPEKVQKLFNDTVCENDFGTVGVKTDSEDQKLKVVEVTTFRLEGKYTDKRHPDEVKFAQTIEEDLSRRDFTINAIALKCNPNLRIHPNDPNILVDPFNGQKDLKEGVIRTVGDPGERFNEDALRMMRAVRFAVELGFEIDFDTRRAIEKHAGLLEMIAKERVRDELVKMIMTPRAAKGIILLEELDLLRYVLPELREGMNVGQNKHHIYSVFEHNIRSLEYAAKRDYSLAVRVASLLHDVGKPNVKQGDGPDSTFHGHEIVGAKIAARALERLRFAKEISEQIIHLIRYHMFYYNVGEISPAGVRRFLARVGPETVPDLIKLREADRIGSGVPKAVPYKLRHLLFMIEKVKRDPVSPKLLKVKGDGVMKILGIAPGPKVGMILAALLEEVLDDPAKNDEAYLESRVKELAELPEEELAKLARSAKERKDEFESGVEEEIKKKYYVH